MYYVQHRPDGMSVMFAIAVALLVLSVALNVTQYRKQLPPPPKDAVVIDLAGPLERIDEITERTLKATTYFSDTDLLSVIMYVDGGRRGYQMGGIRKDIPLAVISVLSDVRGTRTSYVYTEASTKLKSIGIPDVKWKKGYVRIRLQITRNEQHLKYLG